MFNCSFSLDLMHAQVLKPPRISLKLCHIQDWKRKVSRTEIITKQKRRRKKVPWKPQFICMYCPSCESENCIIWYSEKWTIVIALRVKWVAEKIFTSDKILIRQGYIFFIFACLPPSPKFSNHLILGFAWELFFTVIENDLGFVKIILNGAIFVAYPVLC